MEQIKFYLVDAFTDVSYKGNTAGVVICPHPLSTNHMQNIAKELNLSETAFLYPSDENNYHYDVKYFTPTDQVDFCGHATIGAAWVIINELKVLPVETRLLLNTAIGIIPIEPLLTDNTLKRLVMTQAPPQSKLISPNYEELALLLGVNPHDLNHDYPVGLGFSGNWHLLIPMTSIDAIIKAKPQLDELARYNKELGCITTHLFTFCESTSPYKLFTRDFAPAIGIPEDPVTGSANGALCAFLITNNLLDNKKSHHFFIKQGNSMDREGILDAQIIKNNQTFDIKIGGQAVITAEGVLHH